MKIKLKELAIQNFKGCANRVIDFEDKTVISGANATGKTTIFDAYTFLIFGKNSKGDEKFEIRPLDADGNKVHNVEISVEGTFEIDGKITVLKKTQTESWVKRRGTDVAELQGNKNTYEIDGYPRSEKEYKDYIGSWAQESVLRILSNPLAFAELPWKEQRAILMAMITVMTDVELAKSMGGYEDILDELEKAPGTDDILAKYKKSMTELKKRQNDLPVRIDEVSRQRAAIDITELKSKKQQLNAELAAAQSTLDKCKEARDTLVESDRAVLAMRHEASEIEVKANADLLEKRSNLRTNSASLESNLFILENKHHNAMAQIAEDNERCALAKKDAARVEEEIKRLSEEKFPEDEAICPTCGQPFPQDKVDSLRSEFNDEKLERITALEIRKKNFLMHVEAFENSRAIKESELKDFAAEIEKIKAQIVETKDALAALPDAIPMESNEEYQTALKQIHNAEEENNRTRLIITQRENESREKSLALSGEISSISVQIETAKDLDKRLAELQEEQRLVGQKVMDCEKMIDLVERFIREKMDLISGQVNSLFGGVNWRLFKRLINGGVEECCECSIGGVGYKNLNAGHQTIAGLTIIKRLQEYYSVYLPIFIDGAESVNDYNYPTMNTQVVLLKVSDDEVVKVEYC